MSAVVSIVRRPVALFRSSSRWNRAAWLALFAASSLSTACAQTGVGAHSAAVARAGSPLDMRTRIDRYQADRGTIDRIWRVDGSAPRAERMREFDTKTLAELDAVDFDALDQEGRIDWILLRHEVRNDLVALDIEHQRTVEIADLVPFAGTIVDLAEARRKELDVDPEQAAATVDALAKQVDELSKHVEEHAGDWKKSLGRRAEDRVGDLRRSLGDWYRFGKDYDPVFDWWLTKPFESADKALDHYAHTLREKVCGLKGDDDKTILGDPIGRDALLAELKREMIPYTPEELIRIAEKEFTWCQTQIQIASREMGFGDDWKAALEKVKQAHVAPGKQPALIRDLAQQAVDFLEQHQLVTVPDLAKEGWRMEMMTPERQLVSPFFTGGEVISVSYPTDTMTNEQKLMSMRGNNIHFSHATVLHELIPGHHLQGFMSSRYMPHRRLFGTPFLTEGWALWWEMLLWDQGFSTTPEDRIGMLFWRIHRCARIRFSLGFHLGQLTPEQCIDMLVNEVGHERDNAEAEVRRSFNGGYGPLYQCAYMLGALQFRALHTELVDSGKMTNREFHDAILQSGTMPIEMIRARLEQVPLTREFASSWRFYPL